MEMKSIVADNTNVNKSKSVYTVRNFIQPLLYKYHTRTKAQNVQPKQIDKIDLIEPLFKNKSREHNVTMPPMKICFPPVII